MSNESSTSNKREFVLVVGWKEFQYARTDRKPKPPWRWFRMTEDFMRSYLWQSMSKTQQADFVSVCRAASQTGNLVPIDDIRWLRQFKLNRKNLGTLEQLGLIERKTLDAADKRVKELRSISYGQSVSPRREKGKVEAEVEIPSPSCDERTPKGGNFNGVWSELNNALVKAAKMLKREWIEPDDNELRELTCELLGATLSYSQWENACLQVDRNGYHYD